MNHPLVSIIISTFNAERFLQQAIDSVLSQTYQNIELVIIDGGSTDKTMEIVNKNKNKISFSVSEADRGIYDAWNKGIRASKGQYIAFLGADDFYEEKAIERYVSALRDEQFDYISSRVRLIDENSDKCIRIFGKPWKWLTFRKYMCVAHVGSLHHRGLFERLGEYDTSFKIAADYELLLRAKKELKAAFVDDISANMRNGGVSNASSKVLDETLIAKVKNNVNILLLIYLQHYWAVFKLWLRKLR